MRTGINLLTNLAAIISFAQIAPAEITVTQTVRPTFRHATVQATGEAEDVGKVLTVIRGDAGLGSMTLQRSGNQSTASMQIQLPLIVTDRTPPTTVRLGGKTLAELPTPDTLDQRITAFMEVPFHSHSMFTGTELPKPEFEHPGWVETLFGPHTITGRFFSNDHEEVTEAATPGRYGVVVKLEAQGIDPIYRYVTLYRVPKRLNWGRFKVQMTVPDSVGVKPEVMAAAAEQLNDMARWELVDRFEHKLHGAAFFGAMCHASPDDAPFTGAGAYWNADEAWWIDLKKKLGLFEHRYLEYLPKGYDSQPDRRWPLVIYMHGPLSTGTDLEKVKQRSLPKLMEAGKQLPAIVIAPQLEAERWWVPAHVADLVDELVAKYHVDRSRVYLTGINMGGFSSWYTAGFYPEKFAAIVPVRASGDPSLAEQLKPVKVWAFHAEQDTGVPIERAKQMIDAANEAGGSAKLTAIPGDQAAIWDEVYQRKDLWEWLFEQRRR